MTVKIKDFVDALKAAGIDTEVVSAKRSGEYAGCFQVKRSYFYHMGSSSEGFAAAVAKKLGHDWILCGDTDEFRAWPKTSYLVAYFKPADKNSIDWIKAHVVNVIKGTWDDHDPNMIQVIAPAGTVWSGIGETYFYIKSESDALIVSSLVQAGVVAIG